MTMVQASQHPSGTNSQNSELENAIKTALSKEYSTGTETDPVTVERPYATVSIVKKRNMDGYPCEMLLFTADPPTHSDDPDEQILAVALENIAHLYGDTQLNMVPTMDESAYKCYMPVKLFS